MGSYIGKKPSDVPLTSGDITDNIITSSKIVDGTIVNADVNDLAATKLTGSIADARVPASAVTQHVTGYDDANIRADISALALREATNEASAAFNLPNSFIETFTDDTNLGTQTDGDRVSGYWTTVAGVTPTVSGAGNGGNPSPVFSINTTTGLITHTTGSTVHSSVDAGSFWCIVDLGQDVTLTSGLSLQLKTGNTIYSTDRNVGIVELNVKNNAGTWLFGSGGITPTQTEYGSGWATLSDITHIYNQSFNYQGRYTDYGNFPASHKYTWTSPATTISGRYIYCGFTNTYGQIATFNIFDSASGGLDTGQNILIAGTLTGGTNATGTLIQSANAVGSAKTEVSGTAIYKDNAGTATLGTDLKIYFTCNGGSNWTEAASYNAITPVYATGIKQVRLGKTTCTSGTDIRYKAVWANQAASSKETQLHGIGVNY